MKKLLLLLAAFFVAGGTYAQDVYVGGHYSNGNYVAPYYRTAPNSTINDNYSTVGNVNPYTGEAGTIARENNYIYTNSIPEYKNSSYDMYSPIISPTVSSPLGDGDIPLMEETKHYRSNPTVDISKPLYSGKESSLWETDIAPKPSFEKWNTDLSQSYVQQKDGTYKAKDNSDYTGIYWFVGLCFLGVLGLISQAKT